MNLACTAWCLECDWKSSGTTMRQIDKAADKHGRAEKHATSWSCRPVREEE